jgi:hypothetical protein
MYDGKCKFDVALHFGLRYDGKREWTSPASVVVETKTVSADSHAAKWCVQFNWLRLRHYAD